MTLFITEIIEGIVSAISMTYTFKSISSEVCLVSAIWLGNWNGGLVDARHHNVSRVLSAQHTYATDFFLKLWIAS